jgi:hypothetical protein
MCENKIIEEIAIIFTVYNKDRQITTNDYKNILQEFRKSNYSKLIIIQIPFIEGEGDDERFYNLLLISRCWCNYFIKNAVLLPIFTLLHITENIQQVNYNLLITEELCYRFHTKCVPFVNTQERKFKYFIDFIECDKYFKVYAQYDILSSLKSITPNNKEKYILIDEILSLNKTLNKTK